MTFGRLACMLAAVLWVTGLSAVVYHYCQHVADQHSKHARHDLEDHWRTVANWQAVASFIAVMLVLAACGLAGHQHG